MSNIIKLCESEFIVEMNTLESDYNDVDTDNEDLSLDFSSTSSITQFITDFQNITVLMEKYKKLLKKDIKSVKEITDTYTELDISIGQIFKNGFIE